MSYVRTISGTGPGQDRSAGLLAGPRRKRRRPKGPSYVAVGSLIDDLLHAGQNVTQTVTSGAQDEMSKLATQLINSSQFKIVLDKVEASAQSAVKKEAAKNALALFGLAVGAGTIGGAVFKGKAGMIGASVILAGSIGFLWKNAMDTAAQTGAR